MMHTNSIKRLPGLCTIAVLLAATGIWQAPAAAAQIDCLASKDNTLFQWFEGYGDPPNSNGSGNFVGAGRTGPTVDTGIIQRGLLQFDLSEIPADATITSVTLKLSVVDVPKRDKEKTRPFWVAPIEGIPQPGWGEGASVADVFAGGEGQGVDAQPGDATWIHTFYDTDLWPVIGYFGENALTYPTEAPLGWVPADIAPTKDAPYRVSWSNDQLAADVQAWVDGTATDFGWILYGQEDFSGEEINPNQRPSSKRGFASREFRPWDPINLEWIEDDLSYCPTITVVYVPEPASVVLLVIGGMLLWCRRKR